MLKYVALQTHYLREMNKIKLIIFFLFFLVTLKSLYAVTIKIELELENEIVTNVDIDNERKYLFFLNPKLIELDKLRMENVSKNSLVTEIIKKKEVEKFFNLNEHNILTDVLEDKLIKRNNLKNKEDLREILKTKDIDYEKIKEKLKIETLWNQLIYKKYFSNVKIDEVKLKKRLENEYNNKERIYKYNLSEIVLSENVNSNSKEIWDIVEKNIKNIGFENTANIYSVSNTAKNGGLIGWINEMQLSPIVKDKIKILKINEISKPIKIQNKYILIKLNNKMEFRQEINLDEQLQALINKETNRQLNNFSSIYFKKIEKNTDINEY